VRQVSGREKKGLGQGRLIELEKRASGGGEALRIRARGEGYSKGTNLRGSRGGGHLPALKPQLQMKIHLADMGASLEQVGEVDRSFKGGESGSCRHLLKKKVKKKVLDKPAKREQYLLSGVMGPWDFGTSRHYWCNCTGCVMETSRKRSGKGGGEPESQRRGEGKMEKRSGHNWTQASQGETEEKGTQRRWEHKDITSTGERGLL